MVDSLDDRHDLSRSARERFRIASDHALADLYQGNSGDLRQTSLLLLDLATEIGSDSMLAHANVMISVGCRDSDPGAGLSYLFLAMEQAQRANDPEQIGWIEKELGVLFKYLKKYREAITWLKRAEMKVTKSGEVNRTACHLSECYSALGMVDSALCYAQRSNIIVKPGDDPYGFARSQYILGNVYAAKGDRPMAELFYQRTIEVSDSFRVALTMTQALTALGRSQLAAGNAERAAHFGSRSLKVAQRSIGTLSCVDATSLLEEAHHAMGQPDSAYRYLKLHAAYLDSAFDAANLSKVQSMAFNQELKEKEVEKARTEEAAARSRNIQFGIIALIVITLGIFLLIFSRTAVVGAKAIKNLSLIALLLFFEFINLLLHPFLDRITNHSPILMLLCMAAIAGLLIPLHHRMEKLITNLLVSKNNRVRLEAARRTIEELEGAGKSGSAS